MTPDVKVTLSITTSPYNAGVIASLIEIIETDGKLFADPDMVSCFVATLIDGLRLATDDGKTHYLIGRLDEEAWEDVADLLDVCSNDIRKIIAPIT